MTDTILPIPALITERKSQKRSYQANPSPSEQSYQCVRHATFRRYSERHSRFFHE
jgi:hypothetical protein